MLKNVTTADQSRAEDTQDVGMPPARIIKRDGSTSRLDITRIRRVTRWATEGIPGVSSAKLEAGLTLRLTELEISTRKIQDCLITFAASQVQDLESAGWRLVAGRLKVWGLWKEMIAVRGYQYGDFSLTTRSLITQGYWTESLSEYSESELQEAGSWIDPAFDLNFDLAGACLMEKRYLIGDTIRCDTGNYFRPKELPQEAFLATALVLALPEEPESRLAIAKSFYDAIARFEISLPTPMLANARKKRGNTTSCFILKCPDSLEGIMKTASDLARISKAGGGVGIDLSSVRASGSWVQGSYGASNGLAPWASIFNSVACAVNQGGKRAGACTIATPAWHKDIFAFLDLLTESGDIRLKAFDLFTQITCSDVFMERLKDNKKWTLFDPYEVRERHGIDLASKHGEDFRDAYHTLEELVDRGEVEIYEKVSAREIAVKIIESQLQSGLPYVVFRDTINTANTNPHIGYIPSVNLCTESFSVVTDDMAHSCNLLSLNFSRLGALEDLQRICKIAVRLVDNAVTIGEAPIQEAKKHNESFRSIGIGVLGWADWLARREIRYGTPASLKEAKVMFEEFAYQCTKASADLALERGSYPLFPGSQWSKGRLLGNKSVDDIKAIATDPERWEALSQQIQATGIRNGWVTAIAPNTSSSLVQGCTASVLPPRSLLFWQTWSKGNVPVVPPMAQEKQWFYSTGLRTHPKNVIEMTSVIQQWIDTGISMELLWNFNDHTYPGVESANAVDMFRSIVTAWESGCKAMYYIRLVQKSHETQECESCAS